MTVRSQGGFTLIELLVVIALTSVVSASVVAVLMQTMRTEQYTGQLREVMDDGRVSLDRIRQELREARRVYLDPTCEGAPSCDASSRVSFWVDSNQDHLQQVSEQVHYCLREIGTTECVDPELGKKFELVRWTADVQSPDAQTSPANAQIISRTIVGTTKPFSFNVSPPDTSVVTVTLVLDTQAARGPTELEMSSTIRMRNVAAP
jgi:prepilin-type N-terminal cleavage/methylation domain-containing protein